MKSRPRSIEQLIEHQVGRHQLQEPRASAPTVWRPIIVISRQYGSQGAVLAARVGQSLDYTVWDREILQEMARQSRAPERLFEALDERRQHAITELMSAFVEGPQVTSDEFFLRLVRVLHTIGQLGSAVIVGRGSQFVFGPEVALRVRVVSSLEARTAGIASRKNVSHDKAREEVLRVDAHRRAFLLEHYDKDPNDAVHYDIVLNSGALGLDTAAEVILTAYRSRFGVEA